MHELQVAVNLITMWSKRIISCTFLLGSLVSLAHKYLGLLDHLSMVIVNVLSDQTMIHFVGIDCAELLEL